MTSFIAPLCSFYDCFLNRFALAVFIILLPFSGFSQETRLFEEIINVDLTSFSEDQMSTLEGILLHYPPSDVKIVSFAQLSDIQVNGRIAVKVPNDECGDIVFKSNRIRFNNNDDYYWYGNLDNSFTWPLPPCLCQKGTIMVENREGDIFGTINLESRVYSINPLGNDMAIIVKEIDYELEAGICGVGENESHEEIDEKVSSENNEMESRASNGSDCRVDVLFLYTASVPDQTNNARSVINASNQAFRNSDILPSELELRFAGIEQITDLNETNLSCNAVANGLRFSSQQARNFREFYKADIVLLFINQNIASFGSTLGCAFPSSTASTAFGTFGAFNFDPEVAVHEIGHIFGCLHEPCSAINAGGNCENPDMPFRQAHSFEGSQQISPCSSSTREVDVRTVMFSVFNSETILHFSNPEVDYLDEPTGVALDRDNANWLKENACRVANFVPSGQRLTANITVGPTDENCSGSDLTLFAEINGGCPGPKTWQWYKSNNGINYTYLPQYDNVANILNASFEGQPGDMTFYRVVVTSACNETAIAFEQVLTIEECTYYFTSTNSDIKSLIAYPNPTYSRKISFDFKLKDKSNVSYELINKNGLILSNKNIGVLESGNHAYEIQLPTNTTNLYFLKLIKGTETEITKIIRHE